METDPAKSLVVLPGAADGWRASLILDNDHTGVWRMESLQLFPQFATPEVIGLDDDGTCWVMVSYSGKWSPMRVLQDGAWLGAVAYGDLDPTAEGVELYTGGKKGRLYQVRAYADGGLDGRRIATFAGAEIHTLVTGDFDVQRPGRELLLFTRPGSYHLLHCEADGTWHSQFLGTLDGRIRDAILLPDGRQLATASRDGTIRLLHFQEDGTPIWETIHSASEGRGRLALSLRMGVENPILYSTGDQGSVFRHTRDANRNWITEVIYFGPLGPRGLVAGQFDPNPEVETVAVFGYSGRVELLSRSKGAKVWSETTLFQDRDRGHWLSNLEIDLRNNTDEILLSGYGARMVLLSRFPGTGHSGLAVPEDKDRHASRKP